MKPAPKSVTTAAMKQEWLPYTQRMLPRYTSYPTALQFSLDVSSNAHQRRLGTIGLYEPISLYIHIPFCETLCHYCSSQVRACDDYSRAERYVDALLGEMEATAKAMGGCGRVVNVHFGGGTPNYLKTSDLGRILDGIEREFGLTDETAITLEIDPRLVSYQNAEEIGRLGVTRVSLGVQDFNPDVQKAIGRVQPARMVAEVAAAFRSVGIFEVSFDMMYGLPQQTTEGLLESLALAAQIGPDRIALFGYRHQPEQLPNQRLITNAALPDAAARARQVTAARKALAGHGYEMIGFDHFALPGNSLAQAAKEGRLRRNFQGYSDEPCDTIVGLGVSAISQFADLHVQNDPELENYYAAIDDGRLPTYQGVLLSREDQLRASIIADLLCRLETDLSQRCKQFNLGTETLQDALEALKPLQAAGLTIVQNSVIRIPESARALSRVVAHAFDAYKTRHNAAHVAL